MVIIAGTHLLNSEKFCSSNLCSEVESFQRAMTTMFACSKNIHFGIILSYRHFWGPISKNPKSKKSSWKALTWTSSLSYGEIKQFGGSEVSNSRIYISGTDLFGTIHFGVFALLLPEKIRALLVRSPNLEDLTSIFWRSGDCVFVKIVRSPKWF